MPAKASVEKDTDNIDRHTMSRYYRDPLSEHMVTHKHDLREGSMGEPAGGETAKEHEKNKPKQDPAAEALRPSHVLGVEKNAPPPGQGVGLDTGEGRTQEGLRKSGRASEGIGGLEGKASKMDG